MLLMDGSGLSASLKEYLDSRKWWLLADPFITGLTTMVEERYYSGKANEDFHLIIVGDCPIRGFFFARKSRMSRRQLVDLIVGCGAIQETDRDQWLWAMKGRDIILPIAPGVPNEIAEVVVLQFYRWLKMKLNPSRSPDHLLEN